MILCVSSIGLVIFIFSLLFVILTMDTLSKINLMDGWMDIITLSEEARTVAIHVYTCDRPPGKITRDTIQGIVQT